MTKLLSDRDLAEIADYAPRNDAIARLLADRALLMAVAKAAERVNRQAGNEHAWNSLQDALRAAGRLNTRKG